MRWLGSFALLVGTLVTLTADRPPDRPRLQLDISPCMALSPVDVKVRVFLTRRSENRRLLVELHEGDFTLRSTEVQLDGDASPGWHEWLWRGMSGGEVTFDAHLFDTGGARLRVEKRCVFIPVGEPVEDPNPQPLGRLVRVLLDEFGAPDAEHRGAGRVLHVGDLRDQFLVGLPADARGAGVLGRLVMPVVVDLADVVVVTGTKDAVVPAHRHKSSWWGSGA